MTAAYRYEVACRTDKGNVRELNEDSYLDLSPEGLWVVADGMGGHDAGDVASSSIVQALSAVRRDGGPPSNFVDQVEDAVLGVNRNLYQMSQEGDEPTLSGSTVVLLMAFDRSGVMGWAGDSRCYRLRDGMMVQVGHDHSEVEEMVARGMISREEAEDHPQGNVITRAVGGSRELYLDFELVDFIPGDRILLCSDGLYKDLSEVEIATYLSEGDAHEACDGLLQQALLRECGDNVTAIVVDVFADGGTG